MIKILLKLWPALLPLCLYILWFVFIRKKPDNDNDEAHNDIESRIWNWVIISSLILAVFCMLWLAISSQSNTNSTYYPPVYKDGKIVDGRVVPEE